MVAKHVDDWLMSLDDDVFSDIVFPGWRGVVRGVPPEPKCSCTHPKLARRHWIDEAGYLTGYCHRCHYMFHRKG